MKKSYAEICLARAEQASKAPWKWQLEKTDTEYGFYVNGPAKGYESDYRFFEDADFIAEARTAVPELARRLQQACMALRETGIWNYMKLADDLELMPEGSE